MFQALATVRQNILSKHDGSADVTLEQIVEAVCGSTKIDEIVFVEYDVSRDNPFWGGFRHFRRQSAPYATITDCVEIRYASHLSEAERRYVICKELCHALDVIDSDSKVADEQTLDKLVASFAFMTAVGSAGEGPHPIVAVELLAEYKAKGGTSLADLKRELAASPTEDE